ncbi:MAG: AtpZ/AtpI family protein [bacterium]|jgi:ATP synthase protein I|nr:AtpZ/AtpI family protein [bacterium]MDD3804835.1 AtpZ/AtpI family protein [bacterium]MDD4153631.1 AtpZ/AtpI family protein [bacterium]MDD4558411.1 AtpZ/AtpI family protein [bacterium]
MRRNRGVDYKGVIDAASVGIAMVLATVIGFGIGYVLDRRLGTEPWLTVLFTIVGMIAGIINLFEIAASLGRRK